MDTDETSPLVVGRRVQWAGVVKLAKVVAAALAIVSPAVVSSWQTYRVAKAETAVKVAEAENRARQAKQSSEAGFQLTRSYVEALEHRLATLETQARAPKGPRKPPKPAPPRPAPLPKDLNAAEAQLRAKPPAVSAPPAQDGGA